MLKQLIIFLNIVVSCFAVRYGCSISETTCTITGIHLTENDYQIEPVASNPSEITELILNGNLSVLTSGFCKALPNLKNFVAKSVSIEVVKNFTFSGCEKLESIIMERNKFKNLEKYSFKGLKNLMKLRLTFDSIPVFDLDLSDSTELTELYLSSMNISVFSADILREQRQLKELYLDSNNFLDLDVEGILNYTLNLENIYLADNNFRCDRLKKIITLLREKNLAIRMDSDSKKRDYTPERIDGLYCLSEMQWSFLYTVPRLQSTIDTINANYDNFTKMYQDEHNQIDQKIQAKNNQQNYHDTSLWIFTTITFFLCIMFIGYYFITNKRNTFYMIGNNYRNEEQRNNTFNLQENLIEVTQN